MKWPQKPETFEGMDSAALYRFADEILAARQRVLPTLSADDADGEKEYDEWNALEKRVRSMAADAKGNETRLAAEQAEAQRIADEAAAAEAEAERQRQASDSGTGDGGSGDGGSGDGGDDEDDGGDDPDDEAAGKGGKELAGAGATHVPTTMGSGAKASRSDKAAQRWVSTGVASNGPDKGRAFESNLELAEAIREMSEVVQAGDTTKRYLGKIGGRFSEAQMLPTDKPWLALQDMMDEPDEIEAAFCPPATPIYDLDCENATRRPVKMGLPNFRLQADRGAFTVLASPTLAGITTGHGQWTSADDADAQAIKEACQTVSCVGSSTYEIYGIYRCLTVKNLMQMTFAELVAAYLNRLQAASAREAEVLLLEAMDTSATDISAPALGYNAATTLGTTILNYLGLYQETERWDTVAMDAWLPRWVLWAMKTDLMRRRRTDGGFNLVPSDDAINRIFRDAGVEPHWFMDRPSWAAVIPAVASGGVLNLFPSVVDMIVYRRGKFALMDRGELSIGVTGNNIYRLEDDLRRNQFTFFFENFEGLIDTDSCPAHKIRVPACWNGVQIADEVIDCEGNNYAGVGSGGD